jgi:hypothetical protein
MGDSTMTVQFPAIQPTGHEFGEPSWPVTEMRSQSGVRSVRLWGSRASDAPMTLEFSNISQAAYAQIRAAHTAAKGAVEDVAFPAIVGKNLTEVDLLNPGPGLKWYWASPPEGSRAQGGKRISCRCSFRAELRL